jgi:putative copper export protein
MVAEIIILATIAVFGLMGCIRAITNPRRLWELRYGRFIKDAEPTAEALATIRRFGYVGLVILPLLAGLAGYGIYRAAESRREVERWQQERDAEWERSRQEQEKLRNERGF